MLNLFIWLRECFYTIFKYIKRPEKLICDFCDYDNHRYAYLVPDRLYLRCFFKKHMGIKLDLSNPKSFSEKMQWLKLYDQKIKYFNMADKADAKNYVAEQIGEEYIIPTIGVYDSVDSIPFDALPEKYVIKCTHDSGSIFVCNQKMNFNVEEVKEKLRKQLKNNFYWYGREWSYKGLKPKIIVEEFISDENGDCPVDYKFFCFNGKMEVFKIDYNRFTKRAANYYNYKCEYLDFGKINSIPDPTIDLRLPNNFKEMVEISEKLSKGIPFLRVDLYSVDNHIYFGELTFYPSSGVEPFTNNGDVFMGDLLKLPKIKIQEKRYEKS